MDSNKKQIGIIGLGKMGLNIGLNLKDKGIDVFGYTDTKEGFDFAKSQGFSVFETLDSMLSNFDGVKVIWLMVPSFAVDDVLFGEKEGLYNKLESGDIVIDGGNSFYKQSVERYNKLKEKGINFLDCGTSGGVKGAREGACLMVGGDKDVYQKIEWVFSSVAQPDGFGYIGEAGAGHYVKMIHNAIEYAMLEAIGEGVSLVKNGKYPGVDLEALLGVWNHGSIIESYLTKILQKQLQNYPNLEEIEAIVDDNGEGAWTIFEAIEQKVPLSAVSLALFERYSSKGGDDFSNKLISLMRNGFGGHEMKLKKV
jgi:6-phosphogluconate dehydrogenase